MVSEPSPGPAGDKRRALSVTEVTRLNSGVQKSGLWPCLTHCSSLGLRFLICEMGMRAVPAV